MKTTMLTESTRDFRRYIDDWRGDAIDDRVPYIGEDGSCLWRGSLGVARTKFIGDCAIAISTPVWPVLVDDNINLTRQIGEVAKETKHEWMIEDEQMFDYGKYVLIVLSQMMPEQVNDWTHNTIGFFVAKDAMYVPGQRDGRLSKSGKRIAKKFEVQSSSSKKKKYEVLYYSDATISCNCPAWIYQGGATRGCKHTKKVMMEIVNSKPTP